MPDLSLEQQYGTPVAGVDEAGRGPWAGPVVAAAVIIPDGATGTMLTGVDDSKRLSEDARETLYTVIMAHCHVGVGQAEVEEIDTLNILGATKQAMQRAVHALPVVPAHALVDGNQPPALACPVTPVVKGDARSLSIAAASVIAKVTRDRMMRTLDAAYPHYNWGKNKGYGTRAHRDALADYGVTPHHRRSFRPVRECLDRAA